MIAKCPDATPRSRTFMKSVRYIEKHEHRTQHEHDGVSFGDRIAYATNDEKVAWMHMRGVTSVETAPVEMKAAAALSRRCPDPVCHLILAYAQKNNPTRVQIIADAERLLTALDMEDHQYVLSVHTDTDNLHAHVVANRVGPDGKANKIWRERITRERVCAEIAAERGWEIVLGKHNRDIVQRVEKLRAMPEVPASRLGDGEHRRLYERGELPWQEIARPYVLDAVERARSWEDLYRRLDAHGVVAKVIKRGEHVQGLAFVEGADARAPGCGASRIDRGCSLSALEARFGTFVAAHEVKRADERRGAPARGALDVGAGQRWADRMRDAILTEVDAAVSWSDLEERLQRCGVVVKLVRRGERVQGLAFAEGDAADATGCGASRIDDRCKKAALEQRFGPFPREAQEAQRNVVRGAQPAREPEAGRALHEAGRIVDHARMRAEYAAYRRRFFGEKRSGTVTRYGAAWEHEKTQRAQETRQRRQMRLLLNWFVRVASRGALRQLGYWSVNAWMTRRRDQEFATARARWEAVKTMFSVQREQLREEEKPMDYQAFVTERAHGGDAGAQRIAADLARPKRTTTFAQGDTRRQAREEQQVPDARVRTLTIPEVRACLDAARAKELARYESAERERNALAVIEDPDDYNDILDTRRDEIEAEVAEEAGFTGEERTNLKKFEEQKKSWNPLVRAEATRAEEVLRAGQQIRRDTMLRDAMEALEREEMPHHAARIAEQEPGYREYVSKSLALEEEMSDAQCMAEQLIPAYDEYVTVVERAGETRVEGIDRDAKVGEVMNAIDRCYQAVPDEARREIESRMWSERNAYERARGRMSMEP